MSVNDILEDGSIVVDYGRRDVPLYVNTQRLSSFPGMQTLSHWHPDIEALHVTEGSLTYHVNESEVVLGQGDSLVINSRRIHHCVAYRGMDCGFNYLLFSPKLLGGNKSMRNECVTPLIEDAQLEFVHFAASDASGALVADIIDAIAALHRDKPLGYEMRSLGGLYQMWGIVYANSASARTPHNDVDGVDAAAMRAMIAFVHAQYGQRILLEDIARAGGVCRSSCCSLFKRYMGTSPNAYLNAYRLEMSCVQLHRFDDTIARIAMRCGFSNQSYFDKVFARRYGCSPREFRARCRERV